MELASWHLCVYQPLQVILQLPHNGALKSVRYLIPVLCDISNSSSRAQGHSRVTVAKDGCQFTAWAAFQVSFISVILLIPSDILGT